MWPQNMYFVHITTWKAVRGNVSVCTYTFFWPRHFWVWPFLHYTMWPENLCCVHLWKLLTSRLFGETFLSVRAHFFTKTFLGPTLLALHNACGLKTNRQTDPNLPFRCLDSYRICQGSRDCFCLSQSKIVHSCHKKYSLIPRKTNNFDIKGRINLIFSVCLLQSSHVEPCSRRVNRIGSSFIDCTTNIYFLHLKFKHQKLPKQPIYIFYILGSNTKNCQNN